MKGKDYYNDFFHQSAYTFSALKEEEKRRWLQLEQQLDALKVEEKASDRPLKILDFGCGDGRFFPLFSKYGDVYGIDYADKAIERGKSYLNTDQLYAGSITDTAVSELFKDKFDLIVSTEVMEHIVDKDKKYYFDNLAALLKREGMVILTTPNAKVKKHYFSGIRKNYQQPIEDWMSKKEIARSLEVRGFDIISYHTFFYDWALNAFPKTWWNLFFNHLTVAFIFSVKMKRVIDLLFKRMELGLYQMIVAQKR
jgi:2-polyprenyl-3-methyl-5-hydroxy-6-metoxy-1,4-benzoquinol methylase